MGFRYRKSVNMGPFRLNASKSGLGWSVGVPGARYTKMANGRKRVTASIPGTGISWVEESKKHEPTNTKTEPEEETLTGWAFFWKVIKDLLVVLFYIGLAFLLVFFYIVIPFMEIATANKKG